MSPTRIKIYLRFQEQSWRFADFRFHPLLPVLGLSIEKGTLITNRIFTTNFLDSQACLLQKKYVIGCLNLVCLSTLWTQLMVWKQIIFLKVTLTNYMVILEHLIHLRQL